MYEKEDLKLRVEKKKSRREEQKLNILITLSTRYSGLYRSIVWCHNPTAHESREGQHAALA